MAQQAPSAVVGYDGRLLQSIGGQFEQGTNVAERANTADIEAEPQQSTTEDHRSQAPDELTSNDTASASLHDRQESSGTEIPPEGTGACDGEEASASGPELRTQVADGHVQRLGVAGSRYRHEFTVTSGPVDEMSGKGYTDNEQDNWSMATCKGSTSQASSHEEGGESEST